MKQKKTTIWTYNFTALFITNCILFFGQFMMSTLLPKYLSALQLSGTVIGVVVGMFSVTALASRPVTGPLIDGWNKKKLYMLMLCFMVVAFIGYAFVKSVALLIVFRLLHGIGMGCLAALALTMATDALPPEKLASGLSVYGLSSVMATAFGPGIGLALSQHFGYRVTFLVSAALLAISMLIATRMKIEDDPNRHIVFRLDNIFCKQSIYPAFLLMLTSLARAGVSSFLVIYITEVRCIEGISVYYFINAATMLASRPLFGKLADKKGLHTSLWPSYAFFVLTLVLVAVCSSTWQLWILAVINAFGIGTAQSSEQALCMKLADAEHRGSASTTAFIGTDIGDLLGPIICGALVDAFSYSTMYFCCIIPIVVCVATLIPWSVKNRERLIP